MHRLPLMWVRGARGTRWAETIRRIGHPEWGGADTQVLHAGHALKWRLVGGFLWRCVGTYLISRRRRLEKTSPKTLIRYSLGAKFVVSGVLPISYASQEIQRIGVIF